MGKRGRFPHGIVEWVDTHMVRGSGVSTFVTQEWVRHLHGKVGSGVKTLMAWRVGVATLVVWGVGSANSYEK